MGAGSQKINCGFQDLELTRRMESTNEADKKIKVDFYNLKAKQGKSDM